MNTSKLSYLTIFSLIYIIGLTILYFSKSRINNKENKVYKVLLITNFIGLILQLSCGIVSMSYDYIPRFISDIVFKSFFIYFVLYVNTILYYLLVVSFKNLKKINIFLILLLIIECIIAVVLPYEFFSDPQNGIYYTYGTAIDFVFLLSGIICTFMFFLMIIKRKKVSIIKLSPMYLFLLCGVIAAVVQKYNPDLVIITHMETFICCMMYFTIENPDLAMIEQLNYEKDRADKANRAKTDFLSSMSHEIRTPLNAIVGFSQGLKEENLPPSAVEEVNDIIEASETLLDTVNGILDISKIEANKIEIIPTVYDFHKVFDELVALSKARLGDDKPIEFRYKLAEDTPQYLYGDYARVKQVILNFLTNAIKYTNEGYIDFSVKNIVKNGICRLIITVEDSGIGIKKESINKLFDRFERLENENSTIEGTGLGMAITKKLVELMHGKIVVQSIYGKGSQFMVILDQKISEAPANADKTEVEDLPTDLSNKKLLIVDDNKMNIKVAVRLLKQFNINITEATSGFECLDLVNSGKKFDLIFMDDMMPKKSGKETFKELKSNPAFETPVVILTANAISGMKEQYLADGFDDYLAKPIEKPELNRVIKKYLDN